MCARDVRSGGAAAGSKPGSQLLQSESAVQSPVCQTQSLTVSSVCCFSAATRVARVGTGPRGGTVLAGAVAAWEMPQIKYG